ncbi:hypothetical protein PBI_VANISOA_42 [Mycobacterium phage Vanisoa]|nr:hypothetical protein PBI_VANISOA_42 [Mycobacterium phage Vanisoa]
MSEGEVRTAKQYTVLQAVLPFVMENPDYVAELERMARLHMAGVGYVVPDTFEMKVHERARIDGHVLPWEWEGYVLPDDAVCVRFTAFIDPYITEENTDG